MCSPPGLERQTRDGGSTEEWPARTRRLHGACGRHPRAAAPARSGPAQQRVLEQALRSARLPPSAVVHLQLHGTATSLGDPIEVGAASQALLSGVSGSGAASVRGPPLVLHAGKSSVGHTEPAAGVTGLLHSVRSLTQTEVCPVMHLHAASALPVSYTHLTLPTKA